MLTALLARYDVDQRACIGDDLLEHEARRAEGVLLGEQVHRHLPVWGDIRTEIALDELAFEIKRRGIDYLDARGACSRSARR